MMIKVFMSSSIGTVVLFSLLVNVSTIRPLMQKLGFDQFTGEEVAELKYGLI